MAISTLEGLKSAQRWRVPIIKATATGLAAVWQSIFTRSGDPGAGTLAGTDTAAGVIPTDATAGMPTIPAFQSGAKGYITRAEYQGGSQGRVQLFDLIWKAGAYAFNANTAVTFPTITGRLPTNPAGNPDYNGLEIWVEQVTAATGNQAVNVTYTDQDGNTGATTGATGVGGAPSAARMWQLPLASGDSGVRAITNVAGSVASAGTFNVLLMRPLFHMRYHLDRQWQVLDLLNTGMPEVFADSALYMIVSPDSASSVVHEMILEIANG